MALLHLAKDKTGPAALEAEKLLEEAAAEGYAQAALHLGHLHIERQSETGLASALRWYTMAAEAGHHDAQYLIGMMYFNGRGIPRDVELGCTWVERAAQNGYARAQMQLAVLYSVGQGKPKDFAEAVRWYERAARGGLALAQYNLAVMLSKGQGCDPDPSAARGWFEKAALQGLRNAKAALRTIEPLPATSPDAPPESDPAQDPADAADERGEPLPSLPKPSTSS